MGNPACIAKDGIVFEDGQNVLQQLEKDGQDIAAKDHLLYDVK